jgi:hypothetical protein
MQKQSFRPLAGSSELRPDWLQLVNQSVTWVSVPLRGVVNCDLDSEMQKPTWVLGFRPLAGSSELRPLDLKPLPCNSSRGHFRRCAILWLQLSDSHSQKCSQILTGQYTEHIHVRTRVSAIFQDRRKILDLLNCQGAEVLILFASASQIGIVERYCDDVANRVNCQAVRGRFSRSLGCGTEVPTTNGAIASPTLLQLPPAENYLHLLSSSFASFASKTLARFASLSRFD